MHGVTTGLRSDGACGGYRYFLSSGLLPRPPPDGAPGLLLGQLGLLAFSNLPCIMTCLKTRWPQSKGGTLMKFKYSYRNWVEYRAELPNMVECDFHWTNEPMSGLYHENMQAVWNRALQALAEAQANGIRYVLFTHGGSTSGIGKTTARSQVRKLMRSKEATPYLLRRDCIEQDSVFIAAIRPTKESSESAVVVEAERLATTAQPEDPHRSRPPENLT